jgi:hypothetical protein
LHCAYPVAPDRDSFLDKIEMGAGQLAPRDLIGLATAYGNFCRQISIKLCLRLCECDFMPCELLLAWEKYKKSHCLKIGQFETNFLEDEPYLEQKL